MRGANLVLRRAIADLEERFDLKGRVHEARDPAWIASVRHSNDVCHERTAAAGVRCRAGYQGDVGNAIPRGV
jgi:hypothetical protein